MQNYFLIFRKKNEIQKVILNLFQLLKNGEIMISRQARDDTSG